MTQNPKGPTVTCAGGLNVDRILRLNDRARLGTSNPGASATAPGGVARNIADGLVQAGVPTALFGAIGNDDDGRLLLRHSAEIGIDVSAVATVDHPTGAYTAVIDPEGGLVIGVSDMAATEALRADHLVAVDHHLTQSVWLVVDTNLRARVLTRLASQAVRRDCKIAANTVSLAKSGRVKGLPLDLLFSSHDEAEALAETELTEPEQCQAILSAAGFRSAVVTVGADGAWYFDESDCGAVQGIPTEAADTTGAGDALVAETIRLLIGESDLRTAVSGGISVAAEVIGHVGAAGGQTAPRVIT